MSTSAIYQHPLAHLIGLEGVALLRGFAGDYDREFVEARLAEVRALLDPGPPGDALLVDPVSVPDGYDGWSRDYDEPGNGLIDLEQPIVREMLTGLRLPGRRIAARIPGASLPRAPFRRPGGSRPPEPLPAGAVADPWLLHGHAPEATNAAYRGLPSAIFWHLQLEVSGCGDDAP